MERSFFALSFTSYAIFYDFPLLPSDQGGQKPKGGVPTQTALCQKFLPTLSGFEMSVVMFKEAHARAQCAGARKFLIGGSKNRALQMQASQWTNVSIHELGWENKGLSFGLVQLIKRKELQN